MRKLLPALAALVISTLAWAQKPVPKDFKPAVDSMRVLMKERTGVDVKFSLDKVMKIGKTLDFYFGKELGDYPWRPGDEKWFKSTFSSLSAGAMKGFRTGEIVSGRQLLSELPMPAPGSSGKPVETAYRIKPKTGTPLVKGRDSWSLGLSGRHIALWQSHGMYYNSQTGRWVFQRTATHATAEDIYTQSYVIPFLIPMLENAGAVVMTPRERDIQRNEVVCDNDPSFDEDRSFPMRLQGQYSESGSWQDAGEGFADAKAAYQDHDNPFLMGSARKSVSRSGTAVWRPDIPEAGEYAVYVSYKTLPESTDDAVYTVFHKGGATTVHVNQKMGGGTWIYIGTYPFDKGLDGYVRLQAHRSPSGVVSADAVRFGGGMGKADRGAGISGMPAHIEGALSSMQYGGMPLEQFDDWEDDYTKDFAGRGRWVKEMMRRGIPFDCSLAFHSDAGITPDSTIVGTLAIYTYRAEEGTKYEDGSSRMAGRLLSDFVQTQIVNDLRSTQDSLWTRRQTWDRSYSESRTTGVPGMLLEILSHQNFADMRHGLDPQFRFDVSRAVYKGMLKFLSARYGVNYAVQPLPVHDFKVLLEGEEAVLGWEPTADSLEATAAATGYRVYTRIDDGAFDAGQDVNTNSYRVQLQPGHVYSFKVAAFNKGGLSFPSEVLAAGWHASAAARNVVIVNNFTRVSAPTSFDTPTYAGFTHSLDGGVPWGMDFNFAGEVNQYRRLSPWTSDDDPGFGGSYTDYAATIVGGNTFDFVAAHASALLRAGYSFESCSASAWDGGRSAFAADIICGKQVTTRIGRGGVPDRFTVFTPALQEDIRSFTSGGGNIVISGAYIATDAWDTIYQGVRKAPESTRQFVREVLGYKSITNYGDRSGKVVPAAGSGLPQVSYNREYTASMYRVENPDGIGPVSGSGTGIGGAVGSDMGKGSGAYRYLMYYKGTGIGAAVLYNAKGYKVASFGFPLETTDNLDALLKATLSLF
jgi:hypothetical protein